MIGWVFRLDGVHGSATTTMNATVVAAGCWIFGWLGGGDEVAIRVHGVFQLPTGVEKGGQM